MNLSELKKGESSTVISINLEDNLKQRLYNMGLTEGVTVTFIRSAPLLDPIEIKIRDFYLAIRRELAKYIIVSNVKGDVK